MDQRFVEETIRLDDVQSLGEISFTLSQLIQFFNQLKLPKGSTVGDIFAGSGMVNLVAALYGYNSVAIEIDPEHYDILTKNISAITPRLPSFAGNITLLQGDAMCTEIPERVTLHAIITSPPYTLSTSKMPLASLHDYSTYIKNLGQIFLKHSPTLSENGGPNIIIEMGNDIFDGQEVPLKDMLIDELRLQGFIIMDIVQKPDQEHKAVYIYAHPPVI